MAAFDEIFDWTIDEEGPETNDPDDPGGHTKFGISQRSHPDVNVGLLTLDEAKGIYLRECWTPLSCDRLPRCFAFGAFDYAVRTGPSHAAKGLQICLNTEPDGIIGMKTIAKAWLGTSKRDQFLLQMIFDYYRNSPDKFKVGECARVLRLRDLIIR